MIYSTELAIVATTVIALGVSGFVVRRMIQHVDKRIHLMLRASYHNSRDIKENLETVDVVRSETRKALEHQRVLLSSLNQQIKNLESTIAREKFAGRAEPVAVHEPMAKKTIKEPVARKALHEPLIRKKVKKGGAKKKKKAGLLGNLDDFLERGIEQIVANDIQPERHAEAAIELVEETQVAVEEIVRSVEQEPVSDVEQEMVSKITGVQKEVKKSATTARRGGVISMEKLLKQQQRSNQGEKTEKIVKLSSIFAQKSRVSHASDGAGREKNVSVG